MIQKKKSNIRLAAALRVNPHVDAKGQWWVIVERKATVTVNNRSNCK